MMYHQRSVQNSSIPIPKSVSSAIIKKKTSPRANDSIKKTFERRGTIQ